MSRRVMAILIVAIIMLSCTALSKGPAFNDSFDQTVGYSLYGGADPHSSASGALGSNNPFLNYCQKTPFQKNLFTYLEEGVESTPLQIEVPANKVLVIEFISAKAYMQSAEDQYAIVWLISDVQSQVGHFYLLLTKAGTDYLGRDTFIGSQMMRAYTSPGETMTINVIRNKVQGFCNFDLSISGYLQDVKCYSMP